MYTLTLKGSISLQARSQLQKKPGFLYEEIWYIICGALFNTLIEHTVQLYKYSNKTVFHDCRVNKCMDK